MAQAPKYHALKAMTHDELVALYDQNTRGVQLGLGFIREELWRRDIEQSQQVANDAAVTTKKLTGIILVLTVANVFAVAVQVFSA